MFPRQTNLLNSLRLRHARHNSEVQRNQQVMNWPYLACFCWLASYKGKNGLTWHSFLPPLQHKLLRWWCSTWLISVPWTHSWAHCARSEQSVNVWGVSRGSCHNSGAYLCHHPSAVCTKEDKVEWLKNVCVSICVLWSFNSTQYFVYSWFNKYLLSTYHFVARCVTLPCPFWCGTMGKVLPVVTLSKFKNSHYLFPTTHTQVIFLSHSLVCFFLYFRVLTSEDGAKSQNGACDSDQLLSFPDRTSGLWKPTLNNTDSASSTILDSITGNLRTNSNHPHPQVRALTAITENFTAAPKSISPHT